MTTTPKKGTQKKRVRSAKHTKIVGKYGKKTAKTKNAKQVTLTELLKKYRKENDDIQFAIEAMRTSQLAFHSRIPQRNQKVFKVIVS